MNLDIIEGAGAVVRGWFGIRYLVSADYRRRVHEHWRSMSKGAVALELFEGAIAVVFTVIVMWAVLYVIFIG